VSQAVKVTVLWGSVYYMW